MGPDELDLAIWELSARRADIFTEFWAQAAMFDAPSFGPIPSPSRLVRPTPPVYGGIALGLVVLTLIDIGVGLWRRWT